MKISDINALIEERNNLLKELEDISSRQKQLILERSEIEANVKTLQEDLHNAYQMLAVFERKFNALSAEYKQKGNAVLVLAKSVSSKQKSISALNNLIKEVSGKAQ